MIAGINKWRLPIAIGGLWIVLNLAMPQIAVNKFASKMSGWTPLFPFASWHLFSGEAGGAFLVRAGNCGEDFGRDPFDANQFKFLNPEAGNIWQTYARIQYIGNLFEMGDTDTGRKAFKWLVQHSFAPLKQCEFTLTSSTQEWETIRFE